MHIVVFYQYYHNPDCPASARHYTFVREWGKSHRVTVITGNSWYRKRITDRFDWAPPGVEVKMLDIPYDNAMSSFERARSFARYAIGAVRAGLAAKAPDVIFGTSTPLTAAWAASKVGALRRVKWFFEVRDLWPDFPIQMGAIRSRLAQNQLQRIEQRLYHSAAHVITLSPDMERHVLGCGVSKSRVTTLLNGTDFDLLETAADEQEIASLRQRHDLAGKKIVLYAGMLGRANAIPVILEAARIVSDRDDIRFVVIGHGYLQQDVAAAVGSQKNIIAPDPSPRHEILRWFKLADLTLVSFIDLPVLAANSPSKLFDSLGAGTPVVVTNPGWTKAFVESHDCGWYVPPEDPNALAEKIIGVLESPWELARAGVNGRRVATDQFDRRRMAAQLERIFLTS